MCWYVASLSALVFRYNDIAHSCTHLERDARVHNCCMIAVSIFAHEHVRALPDGPNKALDNLIECFPFHWNVVHSEEERHLSVTEVSRSRCV